ncbi:hypothetical protein JAAARDRAFT_564699 [Jaapia argillacea MUCL 33604]|uniref:Nucleolar complex-associated protein 3 n=1 Tax=Jaapia argillacea MUCL 33604 TaxID=933084 RepID=A0A067QE40_9AGAM|nr:hypothetical protein JAAARDRAFT_564699 [Jaapia argillacea MUCL 33604]
MVSKTHGKRSAPASQGPSKRRKVVSKGTSGKLQKKAKGKGKDRASEKAFIEVPHREDEEPEELLDVDLEFYKENVGAAVFLEELDQKAISRSKKETDRLHRLVPAIRRPRIDDDLPSIESHDEEEDVWDSGIDDSLSESSTGDVQEDSDAEMVYETASRQPLSSWNSDADGAIERLPIKLADGRVQRATVKFPVEASLDSEESSSSDGEEMEPYIVEDVATGGRFGRTAVAEVIGNKSRKARLEGAKEQIANICQEILADPDNSLGLLRRLHTFSLHEISTAAHPEPIPNDIVIRKLAILSQLAVYKDIIPGYRIRSLTEKEKAEKVSQVVARTREWEQGLVSTYQSYLRSLEAEIKAKSELCDLSLQSMCTLLVEATHFNFRLNIMTCLVARLSRRSWDSISDVCLNTFTTIFRKDTTGVASLEVVRLLNRMVKERKFNVHPNALSCLLHLRLKTELGVRASESRADKLSDDHSKARSKQGRGKEKSAPKPHLSKKAKKELKEKTQIQREMREAEAEVDKDERASTHTETLKLLFVLYFRIIKNPRPTALLPAALKGISKYAHLVNIDFFKDLLQVLKRLTYGAGGSGGTEEDPTVSLVAHDFDISHRLLCIVTAFELLSGQGEALNIDLSDFINLLYALILPLSLMVDIEKSSSSPTTSQHRGSSSDSPTDMLFRALHLIFSPRTSSATSPSWRSAAFAKRLISAAINWPPSTAVKAIAFVHELVSKDPKLEALLSSEERNTNGLYRPDIDDPQLANAFGASFWELQLLRQRHFDQHVREEALKLVNFVQQ